jgi:Tfp pilus assembly protein PilF
MAKGHNGKFIGNYTQSIKDFSKIIEQYPYFIPAYSGIAEAYQKLGDEKNAFRYRQMLIT